MRDCYWYLHVNEPTRGRGSNKPSVLDLVLSNEEGMVDSVDIEAPWEQVTMDWSTELFGVILMRNRLNWYSSMKKAHYNKMRELLDVAWQESFSEPSAIDNIDKQWNIFSYFSKRYYESEKICVPVRRPFFLKTGRKRFAVPLDRKTLSMAWHGTAVAPVLTHWSCRGLAFGHGCSACMIWCVGTCVFYLLCLHAYLF